MAEDAPAIRRSVEVGKADIAIGMTSGGKVRIRLLLSIEQLEAMLEALRGEGDAVRRNVTRCDAREEKIREEESRKEVTLTRARASPNNVWVSEGTRAWKAWVAHRRGCSIPTVERRIDGNRHTGWYFPSLFPPAASVPASPDQPD